MADKPTNALVQLGVSEEVRGMLDSWRQERELTWSALFAEAAEEFMDWYSKRPTDWRIKEALSVKSQQSFRVTPEVMGQFNAIHQADWSQYPIKSLYWSALLHYMRTHDLFDRAWADTPAMSNIRLPREDVLLIRAYTSVSHYESESAFFEQAIWSWLKKRKVYELESDLPYFDYFPAPESGESVSVFVDQKTHARVKSYASKDTKTIKSIYYNAVREELDRMLDDEDIVALQRLTMKLRASQE